MGDIFLHYCEHCGKPFVRMMCGRCKNAWFCDAICQKAQWSEHKQRCAKNKGGEQIAPQHLAFYYQNRSWILSHIQTEEKLEQARKELKDRPLFGSNTPFHIVKNLEKLKAGWKISQFSGILAAPPSLPRSVTFWQPPNLTMPDAVDQETTIGFCYWEHGHTIQHSHLVGADKKGVVQRDFKAATLYDWFCKNWCSTAADYHDDSTHAKQSQEHVMRATYYYDDQLGKKVPEGYKVNTSAAINYTVLEHDLGQVPAMFAALFGEDCHRLFRRQYKHYRARERDARIFDVLATRTIRLSGIFSAGDFDFLQGNEDIMTAIHHFLAPRGKFVPCSRKRFPRFMEERLRTAYGVACMGSNVEGGEFYCTADTLFVEGSDECAILAVSLSTKKSSAELRKEMEAKYPDTLGYDAEGALDAALARAFAQAAR